MSQSVPRIRMFAGPNGSGKSTIKSVISPELLKIYINPDELEKDIREQNVLDFHTYGIKTTAEEVLDFFAHSTLLKNEGLLDKTQSIQFADGKLIFREVMVNAYFSSVMADFIRKKLIEVKETFTFETVMSSPDKIELLDKAQQSGYRTYLYYVATEDPGINISRIRYRVKKGGHSVPEDKIVSRYKRSLDLLIQAIKFTHRAYIFDNSRHTHVWLAEITDGRILEMKSTQMPTWFKKAVWDNFKG